MHNLHDLIHDLRWNPGFSAKLLLFGEHVLLSGASALATPVPLFGGKWNLTKNKDKWREKAQNLLEFAESDSLSSVPFLNVTRFIDDLKQGLFFDSNIPQGYGLGSSGALCAAIYHSYCEKRETELERLKSIFSAMEGYFHGNSSGIDPLTSYLNQTLLIKSQNQVFYAPVQVSNQVAIAFLMDTGMPRKTGPMVAWFKDAVANTNFATVFESGYLPTNESVIRHWLSGQVNEFKSSIRNLSDFQLKYLKPLIPEPFQVLWQYGLNSDDYYLKLCGAGGGGFILGFTDSLEKIVVLKDQYPIYLPFEEK